jgi:gamma-glutamyltranspeptidase/glutathione hydrolase
VSRPRYHHQFLPDVVTYEPGAFTPEVAAALTARGHRLQERAQPYGNMQAILWDRGRNEVLAASDPRGGGAAIVSAP